MTDKNLSILSNITDKTKNSNINSAKDSKKKKDLESQNTVFSGDNDFGNVEAAILGKELSLLGIKNLSIFSTPKEVKNVAEKAPSESVNIDGVIDASTQGDVGDCWLLSGVNSLSQTNWGRDAIKNSIKYDKNSGNSTITLKDEKGENQEFLITKQELISARNKTDSDGNSIYSKGDDDTLVLELAAEKMLNLKNKSIDNGGRTDEISQMFLGKNNEISYTSEVIKNNFEDLQMKQNLIAATMTIPMSEGKDYHSFSIKRFDTVNDSNYVVLANPWASGEEIWLRDKDATEEKLGDISYNLIYNPDINAKYDEKTHQTRFSCKNENLVKDVPDIDTDGKIDDIKPAVKRNDKNVVNYFNKLKKSSFGQKLIKKNIIPVGDMGINSVKIHLSGAGETFLISKFDIQTAKESGLYCSGDDDAIALELAIERHEKMHKSLSVKDLKKRLVTEKNENSLPLDVAGLLFNDSDDSVRKRMTAENQY